VGIGNLEPELLFMTLMRIGGFVFTAPVFGSKLVPVLVKVWFSLLFALALMPIVDFAGGLPPFGSPAYLVLAGKEVLLGVLIGFICTFFVHAVEFSGHMLGLQMGFAASTLFDPISRNEVSVIGRFQGLLAIVLLLAMNGHHALLSSLASSYEVIGPSTRGLASGMAEITAATSNVFTLAVRISIPVLGALLMVEVGLAILAKTVPQMNIFVVGFPLKIAVGLSILGFTIPYFGYVVAKAVASTGADLRSVLRAVSGG
jgi:flagellar biosynthetic protein FliR